MNEDEDGPALVRCVITVTEGVAHAVYRWSDRDRDGSDMIDEEVGEWTDDEIRAAMADLVGIGEADRESIEVVWN